MRFAAKISDRNLLMIINRPVYEHPLWSVRKGCKEQNKRCAAGCAAQRKPQSFKELFVVGEAL